MIYFITCPDAGAIKIGITYNDPWSRLSVTQTHCPMKVELVGVQEGHAAVERELFARFAAHRIQGEWFRLHDDLLTHIAGLSVPARPPRRAYTLRTREPRWAA